MTIGAFNTNEAWTEAFGALGAGLALGSFAELLKLLLAIEENTRSRG